MHLGYVERNDKVSVILEDGQKQERINIDNIEEILKHENRLEEIQDLIKDLEDNIYDCNRDISNFKNAIKYYLLPIVILFVAYLLVSKDITLITIHFAALFEAVFLATVVIRENKKIKQIKITKNIRECQLDKITKEKEQLEQNIEKLKSVGKLKKYNNISDYIELQDYQYSNYIDETLETIENNYIEQNKPKTLKKVRK